MSLSILTQPATIVLSLLGAFWLLWKVLSRLQSSPLDKLRGPPSASWLRGHSRDLFNRHGWDFIDGLATQYGTASKLQGPFGSRNFFVFDPTALYHIILKDAHAYDQPKWMIESHMLAFGAGLAATRGDHHRQQRKMLNPAFSINHMREMTPLFYKIATKLRNAILVEAKDGPRDMNMLEWMGRAALELVGQGGLGYSFDPLTEKVPNAFGDAMKAYLPTLFSLGSLRYFSHYVKYLGSPSFRRSMVDIMPYNNLRRIVGLSETMHSMAYQVFESKKQAFAAGDEAVLEQVGEGRDLMSILLKANMTASEDQRLPEHELIGQMSSLVFAATDTTSTALTQILQLLSEHPEAQTRLRAEIREAAQGGEVPYDSLVNMPYLDAICRETLRLYAPVSFVFRECIQDNILPLAEPIEGASGEMMNEIEVPKGTTILIGIRACNRNKAIWGPDALEWKPERWLSPLPKAVTDAHIPGVYSNLMTFLGGGRSCIGFKFSQLEMKVILSVLINSFKIFPPDNKDDVVWNLASVRYPTVGKESTKPAFPMKLERLPALSH